VFPLTFTRVARVDEKRRRAGQNYSRVGPFGKREEIECRFPRGRLDFEAALVLYPPAVPHHVELALVIGYLTAQIFFLLSDLLFAEAIDQLGAPHQIFEDTKRRNLVMFGSSRSVGLLFYYNNRIIEALLHLLKGI